MMQGNSLISEFMGINFDTEEEKSSENIMFKDETAKLIEQFQQKKNDFLNESNVSRKSKLKEEINNLLIKIFETKLKTQKADYFNRLKDIENRYSILPNEKQKDELIEQDKKKLYKESGFNLESAEKQLKELTSGKKIKPFFLWNLYFSEVFHQKGGFNVVIGNPPYGFHQIHNEHAKRYFKKQYISSKGSFEHYFLFYEGSLRLLSSLSGFQAFIAPITWLTIPSAFSLRKYILSNYFIKEISWLSEQVFVQASVNTLISFIQSNPVDKVIINIFNSLDTFPSKPKVKRVFERARFIDDKYYISIFESDDDKRILQKITKVSQPLAKYALPCSGYNPYEVGKGQSPTGGPQTIQTVKTKPYHSDAKLGGDWKPEIIGRDLRRYSLYISGKRWIKYGPWLAAPRKKDNFSGKRILVQEITGGKQKQIVATYCDHELYYSRDVIPIKTHLESPAPFFLLALINSKLFTWYHHKRNPKAQKGLFPKVIVSDLKKLPIFELQSMNHNHKTIHDRIVTIVIKILDCKSSNPDIDTSALEAEIDQLIYQLYGLTEEEINIVEKNLRR